jgi:uroporphyrinogen-III synthase
VNLLSNKSLLITKSKQDADKALLDLTESGVDIIYFPTIKIIPIPDSPVLNDALLMFDTFDYLVFTSTNAVEVFNNIAENRQLEFSSVKVAAVGKSTEEKCRQYEINVDILPDEFSAKGLINKFSSIDLIDKKIFVPGSSMSRGELEMGLSGLGAHVIKATIYDVTLNDTNTLHNEIEKIKQKLPDIFTFTSPSSFNSFLEIMSVNNVGEYFGRSTVCAIGTTTEEAIRAKGLAVHIIPRTFSLSGIAEAIKTYFQITANMA